MFEWAKNNIQLYSAILIAVSVLLTVLVCWIAKAEHLQPQMVAPSFEAAHTAALLEKIHRPSDGMTYVDLALEDQLLAPR